MQFAENIVLCKKRLKRLKRRSRNFLSKKIFLSFQGFENEERKILN